MQGMSTSMGASRNYSGRTLARVAAMTDYRNGVRAAAAILLGLVVLCALASLSGCLTASKIHRWEFALLGWARKGTPECVDAAKVASKYLVHANRRLQGATGATDVQTDGEAKKLMQDAARKCGEVVP